MIAYVDGTWSPSDEARISVLDHGLLYGDGVFEGIRFYRGKAFLLDAAPDVAWRPRRARSRSSCRCRAPRSRACWTRRSRAPASPTATSGSS